MATNGSFYQLGLSYGTAETGLGNVPASATPTPAPSSFYQGGAAYTTIGNTDALTASLATTLAATQASQAAAATSASQAAASLAAMSPATVAPLMDATAAVGTSTLFARQDHVHPTDTSRASAASPTFTGPITAAAKGHLLGTALGTPATGAVTPADANVLLYNFSSTNWSGIGTDSIGALWFRTGLSGTPVPALYIDTSQVAHFQNGPTAPTATVGTNTTQLATTQFVTTAVPVRGHIPGETSNGSAAAGEIGEFISAQLVQASELTLVTSTQTNVVSISLTAGDWDVWGTLAYDTNAATVVTATIGSISTTSATLGLPSSGAYFNVAGNVQNTVSSTGMTRLSLSATTTVYLVAFSTFTTNTQKVYGGIFARRQR